ncbi:helix-turn-helix domain-containing protein [Nocardia sp. NPDC002869]|uniref:helix-turn-helix domain-containing protein n=1 Tax=Nocardia sp. NPDC002869 TaxID=3161032 RepID=UPI00398D035F
MNHNEKALSERAKIATEMRAAGKSYRDIARRLGIPARKVEAVLGEIAALKASGHSQSEIGRVVGLPRTTVRDLLRSRTSPQLTARKSSALSGLSDMSGMQLDVLAQFLGMSMNHTYVLVAELAQAKLVHPLKQVQPGAKWVYPTRDTAAQYLGWKPREWTPPLMYANHYRAVAQARIMLVGPDPDRWVSERVLRRRAEQQVAGRGPVHLSSGLAPQAGRPHVHDARFARRRRRGEFEWWALEVELTRKTVTAMDTALQGAIRAIRDSVEEPEPCVGLLYLCRSASVMDGVHAAAQRLPAEFSALDFELSVLDFDDRWGEFLANQKATRVRKGLHVTKEAS